MLKGIAFLIFFCVYTPAQVQYDPETGELLDQKKYDPNTGEEIEQKYDPSTGKSLAGKERGMTAKVVLITGDTIQGKLVSQDREKIILESQVAGTLSIDRAKIEKITIGGVPMSTRRSEEPPAVRLSDLSAEALTNEQVLIVKAKNEARKNSSQYMNFLAGTGACFLTPFTGVSLPIMGLAIIGGFNVKSPDSKFYDDLDQNKKKQYKTTYKKETRRLRTIECFLPTALAFGGIILLFP